MVWYTMVFVRLLKQPVLQAPDTNALEVLGSFCHHSKGKNRVEISVHMKINLLQGDFNVFQVFKIFN